MLNHPPHHSTVEPEKFTEEISKQLKLEINELLWRRLPGKTTLYKAEYIATAIYDMFRDAFEGDLV